MPSVVLSKRRRRLGRTWASGNHETSTPIRKRFIMGFMATRTPKREDDGSEETGPAILFALANAGFSPVTIERRTAESADQTYADSYGHKGTVIAERSRLPQLGFDGREWMPKYTSR